MDFLMLKFKQYINEQAELDLINEGVNDPAIFKAVFLAGGPGSGKSFIVGKTGLGSFGFRVVNSDDAFENAMKKAGMEMNPDNIFSVKGQELRGKATKLTAAKQEMYLKGRLGIVIDGTGKDSDKIKKQRAKLEKMGYDTAIIVVNTNLETAVDRDAQRKRSIGKKMLTPMWQAVQDNIGTYQQMFGQENTFIVDNSEGKDFNKETMAAYKGIGAWSKKPVKDSRAKKWIKSELKNKTR
jgi:shikimate kinase